MNLINDLLDIKNDKTVGLVGLNDELFSIYINKLFNNTNKNILIVTSTLYEANILNNFISNYSNNTYLFPMDDFLTTESVAISPDLKINRLETLNNTLNDNKKIIVTHLDGFLRFLPPKKVYKESIIKLHKNMECPRDELVEKLYRLGYERESIVTKTGEIGVRGFIIDVFSVEKDHPYRIEFFGDEIDSLRVFDEETQTTTKELDEIEILPNTEFISDKPIEIEDNNYQKYLKEIYGNEVSSIYDYLDNPITVFKNYNQILVNYKILLEQILEYKSDKSINYNGDYINELDTIKLDSVIYYNTIDNIIEEVPKNNIINFNIKEINNFSDNVDLIKKFISDNLAKNKTIVISVRDYQVKSIVNYLDMEHIITDINHIYENKLNIIKLPLNKGFIYGDIVLLTEYELFSKHQVKTKYKTNFKYTTKIKNINNLEIGDYVVHYLHGIGRYNGIKTLKQGDYLKDYIEILYDGKDKLYIPVEKIDMISKYTGKEGYAPKVNKLSGQEWEKTKARVRSKVKDIAEKLLSLYAAREMKKGFSFSKDDELQEVFESEFAYEPTKDQLLAASQIKEDMEKPRPMDRLLCGDVGYGKTEVAFRAIFKAVKDGKQVMYLCPTTILSNQQYENALERFKNFPIEIAILNRFTSIKESRNIVEKFNDGKIDLLFGTHRILSDDIKPKNLGLLIIDEEQRFGVVHKEKIKEYKDDVDVLTLTATPIPRTLQMSLSGLRSLSLIETPPVDRYPVQTYVIEENNHIIKDAIYKELSRNGQIFILYNNIEKIEEKERIISHLVPEARIVVAHGQLNKIELEEKMSAFINHEYDILLCTTIIETGIDIPNVNTLIIYDADHFGLSQLYQIRGRVGRSNKIAYAYLTYGGNKLLNETAMKRLNVIKEFTELGSGFKIATRDLSIRGAGDILGSEQAGFIDNIGIELYMKILNDEIAKLKGEEVKEETVKEEKPLLNVETHISNEYVDDNDLKIEIHKKINEIDSFDKLNSVKKELEDRFGKVDEKVIIYMYEEWFEKLAKKCEVEQVVETRNSVELYLSEEMTKKVDGEKLFTNAYNISRMFRFQLKYNHLIIILDTIKLEENKVILLTKLLNTLEIKG